MSPHDKMLFNLMINQLAITIQTAAYFASPAERDFENKEDVADFERRVSFHKSLSSVRDELFKYFKEND